MRKRIGNYGRRYAIAKRIAQALDNKDNDKRKGVIDAQTWNIFVAGKGNTIDRFIRMDDAIKSICHYLKKEARKSGNSVSQIGNVWEAQINDGTLSEADNASVNEQKIERPSDTVAINGHNTSDDIYNIDNNYSKLSQKDAEGVAKNDKRLEKLEGGAGWSVSDNSFRTDIKYARKNTGEILSFIAKLIGADIVVTSALATGQRFNPHKRHGYSSHHNAENPKLDIKSNTIGLKELERRLAKTGFFKIHPEWNHLDVQIKPEVYLAFENGMNGDQVLAYIQGNKNTNFVA